MNFSMSRLVLSMTVLGLVSCPLFAATNAKHKHHHHKMVRHHRHHRHHMVHEVREVPVAHDYKDMGSLPPAPEPVCTMSQANMILDVATQNMGRAMPSPCTPGWFNRIALSGGVNVDVGKWGNRGAGYTGVNYQRFSLNDVYINLAAHVSDWSNVFASISYDTATVNNPNAFDRFGTYSAAYSENATGTASNALRLQQAYMTWGNFDESPFYVQVGKQFQDFGRYELHPITRSLTQVMSETLATSAKIGFIVPTGFSGSLYAFDDPLRKNTQSRRTTNYGVSLNYAQFCEQLGWDVGAAYLYNLIGVNDVAYAVNGWNVGDSARLNSYHSRASGVAVYADVNSGPFSVGARYTTAVQRFNVLDLPKHGIADIASISPTTGVGTLSPTAGGAKPWAAGIEAGYNFDAWCRDQNIYVGYQASREAGGLNIPKDRWLAGYTVHVFPKTPYSETTLTAEWDHDTNYSAHDGGGNGSGNLVTLRAAAKFG